MEFLKTMQALAKDRVEQLSCVGTNKEEYKCLQGILLILDEVIEENEESEMSLTKTMLSDIRHNLNNDLTVIDGLMAIAQKSQKIEYLKAARERLESSAGYLRSLDRLVR